MSDFENYFYHKPTKQHGETIAATARLRSIAVRGKHGQETFRAPAGEFINLSPQEAYRLSIARPDDPQPFLDDADEIARLIEYVRPMVERDGVSYLDRYRTHHSSACGCLGVRNEDRLPLCPCAINSAITERLVPIMAAFDSERAATVRAERVAGASRY